MGEPWHTQEFGKALESNSIPFLLLPHSHSLAPQSLSCPMLLLGTKFFLSGKTRNVLIQEKTYLVYIYIYIYKRIYHPCLYLSFFLLEQQAMFNYRLSRARRVIENTFGILAARLVYKVVMVWFFQLTYDSSCRWRIFRRPIIAQPDCVILYAKATIALHNYLRTTESSVYCPPGYIDGEDGAGNYIAGGWKADEDPCTGMLAVACTSSNRYIFNYIYFKCFLLSHNISPIHVIYNV